MLRSRPLALVLAAFALSAVVFASAASAQEDAKPKKDPKPRSAIRGEYAQLALAAELTEEQKAKLETLAADYQQAQKAWMEANSEKIEQLNTEMKQARDAKDKDAVQRVAGQMKSLREEQMKMKAEHWEKVNALLTPEQQQKWQAFQMKRQMLATFAKADLTDEQKSRIEFLAADAAKAAAAAEDDQARKAVVDDLKATIQQDVLTAEQREKLTRKPAKPEGAAEGDKPAKKPRKQKDQPAETTPDEGTPPADVTPRPAGE